MAERDEGGTGGQNGAEGLRGAGVQGGQDGAEGLRGADGQDGLGGGARMVDVGGRQASARAATAVAVLAMRPATLAAILEGRVPKGDVLNTARIAGVQAAKRCPDWLPLCHPIPLDGVEVKFEAMEGEGDGGEDGEDGEAAPAHLVVAAQCRCEARTGVEMEALCAVSCAALCVYDMCKALDPEMEVVRQGVLEKRGGRGGDWRNPGWEHGEIEEDA